MKSELDRSEQRDAGTERSLGEIGLERYAPYVMNRIMSRYNSTLKSSFEETGLSMPKARALGTLSVRNGLGVGELSVYVGLEQSTMSRTLDQLEKDGLVAREDDAFDSRARRIKITDEGRRVFDAVWPKMLEAETVMFAGVDPADQRVFQSVLLQIHKNTRVHAF